MLIIISILLLIIVLFLAGLTIEDILVWSGVIGGIFIVGYIIMLGIGYLGNIQDGWLFIITGIFILGLFSSTNNQ